MLNNFKKFIGGDYTPIEHAVIGLLVQGILFIALGWMVGYLTALAVGTTATIAFFAGREHGQAEEKLVGPLSRNQAAATALLFWRWDRGSQWDVYAPTLTVVLSGAIALYYLT